MLYPCEQSPVELCGAWQPSLGGKKPSPIPERLSYRHRSPSLSPTHPHTSQNLKPLASRSPGHWIPFASPRYH